MTQPKEVVIYGAGGFGREVAWLVSQCNIQEKPTYDIKCFIDDNQANYNRAINGIPVFSLDAAYNLYPGAFVLGGVGGPKVRRFLMEKAAKRGFRFESVIHPRIERSEWIEIGEGVLICAGNILTTNIVLADHVQINLDCTIGHDVTIGEYGTLAPGVHISGCVRIGKGAYIGTGAVVINGTPDNPLTIGDDAVIGAGACVTKSVPAGITVVGVPAKPLQR